MRAYFCLFGRCRELRTGIGKNNKTKSDNICIAALENQSASLSTQYPGCVEFQNFDTGMQVNMELIFADKAKAASTPRIM